MKTVFILGAGASQQAGAPLMSNFLDRAYDLLRLKTQGIVEVRSEFEDVFNSISELQGVHSKAYLDLDNIEIVFGAIEMALLLKKLGDRSYSKINKLRNSLITLIYKTLEYSIPFPVAKKQILPPSPYGSFMTALAGNVHHHSPDPKQYSFITFNYDLCLDYALYFHGHRFDYCLDGKPSEGTIPLLKLHGSINWGTGKGKRIIPYHVSEAKFNLWMSEPKSVYFNLGTTIHFKKHEGIELTGPPVIVPPTWNKNSYHSQLSNVWAVAAEELSTAENIFVIGYSLPETDSFFRYLYALGSEGTKRLRNFIVINKDSQGNTEKRFRELIGRGISNRFKYISSTFENEIPLIGSILENP